MKVLEVGHVYQLDNLDHYDAEGDTTQKLTFVNREDNKHPGTQVQEVLRALIDRTRHCDNCMPHRVNEQIIHHFRMALALHEARAIERQVEKGEIEPEKVLLTNNGHFALMASQDLLNQYKHEEETARKRVK